MKLTIEKSPTGGKIYIVIVDHTGPATRAALKRLVDKVSTGKIEQLYIHYTCGSVVTFDSEYTNES